MNFTIHTFNWYTIQRHIFLTWPSPLLPNPGIIHNEYYKQNSELFECFRWFLESLFLPLSDWKWVGEYLYSQLDQVCYLYVH